jgi:hypothetical protein
MYVYGKAARAGRRTTAGERTRRKKEEGRTGKSCHVLQDETNATGNGKFVPPARKERFGDYVTTDAEHWMDWDDVIRTLRAVG